MMRPLILRTSLVVRDDEDFSMNCRILACTAAGALALALTAVPAAADVTTYTFTGEARVWLDNTSMFGDVNGDNDRSFTAVFTRINDFDPSQLQTDGATYSQVADAPFYYTQTTVLSRFTMGGVTVDFGTRAGSQYQEKSATREIFAFYTDSWSDNTFDDGSRLYVVDQLQFDVSGFGTNYLPSYDFRTLPSLTLAGTPGFNGFNGYMQILQERTDPFGVVSNRTVVAYLNATRLDVVGAIPVGPAVPEPGTWALLIVGFASVGATLRRRRRGLLA
jgi:PEP-CTERM motif